MDRCNVVLAARSCSIFDPQYAAPEIASVDWYLPLEAAVPCRLAVSPSVLGVWLARVPPQQFSRLINFCALLLLQVASYE